MYTQQCWHFSCYWSEVLQILCFLYRLYWLFTTKFICVFYLSSSSTDHLKLINYQIQRIEQIVSSLFFKNHYSWLFQFSTSQWLPLVLKIHLMSSLTVFLSTPTLSNLCNSLLRIWLSWRWTNTYYTFLKLLTFHLILLKSFVSLVPSTNFLSFSSSILQLDRPLSFAKRPFWHYVTTLWSDLWYYYFDFS